MDGPSVDHSDSDSGESWTILENNSVYADEPPEFIEEHEKHGAQHHDKDEDTDGISIISDSDHETPSLIPRETIYEKCQKPEDFITERDTSETVDPHISTIRDDDDHEPASSEDFLGDSHVRHKTYVHRRNKRLSTVLNIIVLGSVITAAGVAIGHMWGAKNDCMMQTTSSVNKILSNLYKLQEENAYLRGKLKELTYVNDNQVQHKTPHRNVKCKKVFEESLSNYEPRKLTTCVDENYKNTNNLIEQKMKPKYEKEFVADINKLKTVYLQNKSWLDDEISRRMKIEEELLKKYREEVNSAKDLSDDSVGENNNPDAKLHKEEIFDDIVNLKTLQTEEDETEVPIQSKLTNADSLNPEQKPRFRRNEERYEIVKDKKWSSPKKLTNFFDEKSKRMFNEVNYDIDDSLQPEVKSNSNHVALPESNDDLIESKPKFRRNEERYENDYDNFILAQKTKNYQKEKQVKYDDRIEEKPKVRRNEERYDTEDDRWSRNAQDTKNVQKKEKRNSTKNSNKKNSEAWKNNINDNRSPEYLITKEDTIEDNRYVINKFKQEKKRNGNINSNKKENRKNKFEKLNMKGEFGEKFDDAVTSEDFVLKHSDEKYNIAQKMIISNIDATDDMPSACTTDLNDKRRKELDKEERMKRRNDYKEHGANWFERRAIFRNEARKKYYEQFAETTPSNSSWYFRRMRKREQCRVKGDNSTFRQLRKEKQHQKMKH